MAESGIRYQIVKPEQYKEALDLFNTYFLPYEPTCRGLGCGQQSEKMDEIVLDCLKSNLSWCAVEETTGKMIGLMSSRCELIDDLPDIPPTFGEYIESGLSREIASIWVLFDLVLNTKDIMKKNQERKMLMLFALCVHSAHRNKGIGGELVRRTMNHAVKCGYSLAAVICTSSFTQKIFEKLEFNKVNEIEYANYTFDGTYLFKNVEKVHKSVISYVKKLELRPGTLKNSI